MFLNSFLQLLPILIIAGGGYLTNKLFNVDNTSLIRLVVDFFMPMLVFHSLYYSDLTGTLMLDIAGATTVLIVVQTALSYLYAHIAKIDVRGFMPPAVFMNSGFLGIPLMKLWGGVAAMNVIVVFDQIQTVYVFTIGLMMITGGLSSKSLSNMFKAPILWAIFAGFGCKFLGLSIPEPIMTTFEFGGNAGPPLAAFVLGASLHTNKVRMDRHVVAGILIRVVGGFVIAWFATKLFGLQGVERTVVIVASSLPAAVFTSVLPMRYGVPSQYAGSIVIISTLLSVVTIPLAFMLAG